MKIFYSGKNFIVKLKKSLKLNLPGLMLMAGQGKRVKNLREKKPFLQIRKYKAYEFILTNLDQVKNYSSQ